MNKKYILPVALASLMLASCADEFDPQIAPVQAPIDAAKQAELGDLKPLKEYVDRSAHPDFKISGALTASTFNDKTDLYHVAVTNFDEIVAGNAMKMSSVVSDKGEFNYSTVNQFVQTADEAGLTVYGHTLAWHAQQPVKWLNKLLADKQKPKDPNAGVTIEETEITTHTYTDGPFPFFAMGCEPPVENGALHYVNTDGAWSQFFCCPATALGVGENVAYFEISCDVDATIPLVLRNGWGDDAQVISCTVKATAGESVAKVAISGVTGEPSANYDFILQPGTTLMTLDIKSIKVCKLEEVGESDVEYKDVWSEETCQFIARDATHTDTEAEIVAGAGPNGIDAIKVVGKTDTTNPWDTQFFVYTPDKQWEAGSKYRFHMWYKATKAVGTDSQIHSTPGNYIHWAMLSPNPSFTTEWQEKTWETTIPADGGGRQQSIAFNLNKNRTAGDGTAETVEEITYYFAGITWESCTQVEVPKTVHMSHEYVENTNMEGTDASGFCKKENNGAFEYVITDGVGKDGSRGVQVVCPSGASQDWDTQFWIVLNEAVAADTKINVTFDYKATASVSTDTQAHGDPGNYQFWACAGTINWTTEWQTYTKEVTVDASMAGANGMKSIAFNLSKDKANDITFYFDNIRVWREWDEEVKSTIPLTDEEKKDTLIYAMNKWIAGMMDATEGKVKAWDLVNEAISGGGDVEGNYALQHGSEDNTTDFFWQDYLGDVDYVRVAARAARAEYANAMKAQELTDDGKLKLFINDYNLESDWDQNKKLKSLIYWIGKWEEDGETKIDGIGTQMHISYYENAETQASKKAAITNMFELMAKTGKLVRISELDMGYVDAEGKTIGWADMAEDYLTGYTREKAMEEFYEWIIQEYFRVVPAAQQYGICQWCLTDATGKVGDSSGWRPGEPVGLWDTNWYRKYTYRGYVNGLSK